MILEKKNKNVDFDEVEFKRVMTTMATIVNVITDKSAVSVAEKRTKSKEPLKGKVKVTLDKFLDVMVKKINNTDFEWNDIVVQLHDGLIKLIDLRVEEYDDDDDDASFS
jgi:hypothetical protein